MGGIIIRRGTLKAQLGEIVGIKTGLALNEDRMRSFLPDYDILDGNDDAIVRVRSEEIEDVVAQLMYAVGNITSPNRFSIMDTFLKHKDNPEKMSMLLEIAKQWSKFLEKYGPLQCCPAKVR